MAAPNTLAKMDVVVKCLLTSVLLLSLHDVCRVLEKPLGWLAATPSISHLLPLQINM